MKSAEEIIEDLRKYFQDPQVSCGLWKVEEINIIFNKKIGAVEVKATLLPRIKCRSLSDLGLCRT